MNNNPVEQSNPKQYRKDAVITLDDLIEMDKIKVIQAERLCYKGLLPYTSRKKVDEMLERFKQEREEEVAREKMEFDLYIEMNDDKGIS